MYKKILVIVLTLTLLFSFVACSDNNPEQSASASSGPSASATAQSTVSGGLESDAPTQGQVTDNPTKEQVTDKPTGTVTNKPTGTATNPTGTATTKPTTTTTTTPSKPGEMSPVKIYGQGYNNHMLVGIDQFDRTFDIVSGDRDGKQVGIFYWLWMGQPQANGIYDATKILKEHGQDVLFHQNSSVSPDGQAHWWGEPLYGYYNSADEFVIRKHMELFISAGIDFIVFDTTNALTYRTVYSKVAQVICELVAEGWNPPKMAFYTHSRSMDTTRQLYKEFYKRGQYTDSWYMVDGKPFIIAYTDPALDKAEAIGRGETTYNPEPYSTEIANFFTFRVPQWPIGHNEPYHANGFPWMTWQYPQYEHNGVMCVTVAAHPMVPMSFSITRADKGWLNWGRGYNVSTGKNVPEDAEKGTLFQSMWDVAINNDPDTVFVGGWNEWIAYKQPWDGEYMLCDAASLEYSRDIEMMKGGYNDAFYIQLIKNIRRFKGVKAKDADIKTLDKTIDIKGSPDQWNDVNAVYRDIGAANYERNAAGAARGLKYTQAAARNNLQMVKVTKDKDYIYFYVESDANITANDGKGNWMNIFLTAGDVRNTGWVCYDYVINRSSKNGVASIEKLKADGSSSKIGEAKINVSGKVMQVAVPRSAVGLTSSNEFYFKVADGVENPKDIMDYYVTGRSLPMGRLSYKFVG